MNTAQLYKKMSRLETENDQLEMELREIDTLLKEVGFPNGLQSAKEVALELLEENQGNLEENPTDFDDLQEPETKPEIEN